MIPIIFTRFQVPFFYSWTLILSLIAASYTTFITNQNNKIVRMRRTHRAVIIITHQITAGTGQGGINFLHQATTSSRSRPHISRSNPFWNIIGFTERRIIHERVIRVDTFGRAVRGIVRRIVLNRNFRIS